jgi:ABC-type branched-subunit amino acid transport system substrate-binding protein
MSGSPPSPQNPDLRALILTLAIAIIITLVWIGSSLSIILGPWDRILTIAFTVMGGFAYLFALIKFLLDLRRRMPVASPVSPSPQRGGWRVETVLLAVDTIALLAILLSIVIPIIISLLRPSHCSSMGIGVTQQVDQLIGISDGCYAFDTQRASGDLKHNAALAFQQGDVDTAMSKWHDAIAKDTSEAEARIYLEDEMYTNQPHITIVAATMLSGTSGFIGIGRSDLQGIYVAQHDANEQCLLRQDSTSTCYNVRVLIANLGGDEVGAQTVAQQIVALKKQDPTFVGVIGLPVSLPPTIDAIRILAHAHIPIMSSGATSDDLTDPFLIGQSLIGYFQRVVPFGSAHGFITAKFAAQELNARTVAVLVDNAVPYSYTLANSFDHAFTLQNSSANVFEDQYTKGNKGSIGAALDRALIHQPVPDLLYFAGYSDDLNALLDAMSNAPPAQTRNIHIMGGPALYELGGYSQSNFKGIYFTGFAYPDEWSILAPGEQVPRLLTEYAETFGPTPPGQSSYGYTRPDDKVIVAYDAMTAMLKGCYTIIHNDGMMPTPENLHQALTTLSPFQGASGQIAFASDGNPLDKVILVLCVGSDSHIRLVGAYGRFLLSDKAAQTRSFPLTSCA